MSEVKFFVGLNVAAVGSKRMSSKEKGALEMPKNVYVLIKDVDEDEVLVDEVVGISEFSTGSVGYRLSLREATFKHKVL